MHRCRRRGQTALQIMLTEERGQVLEVNSDADDHEGCPIYAIRYEEAVSQPEGSE